MEPTPNPFEIHLDQQSVNYLSESARWARFLSIVGFISCGFIVILGVFFASPLSSMMSEVNNDSSFVAISHKGLSLIYFFIASIIFLPSLFLSRFSSKMRKAFQHVGQEIVTDSLRNLKSFFKFYGIITVITLSFYALAIIAAIIGAMVGHRS